MSTSYGRSSAGYLWAILEPLGGIVILSVAFSVIMRSPALGESFPLFYATGMLPFTLYAATQSNLNATLRQNKQLLFYPRVTYMDALLSRLILTVTTQLLVSFIVFAGIIMWEGIHLQIDLVTVIGALFLAGFLGLGIGTLNSVLIYLWPSWVQIWGIVTKPLFIASGIFYLYDTLPELAQDILWYNPLIHIVGLTRMGFYSTYQGDYILIAFPLSVGAICFVVGLLLLRRFAQDMINN